MSKRHKELKSPDEFVTVGQKVLHWVTEQQVWVALIGGGLILAILLTFGVQFLLRRQLEQNFARLDSALKIARTEVGPKEVRSLEELSRLEKEGDVLSFETEEEKWKAFAKKLDEVEPKLSRVSAEEMAAFYRGEAATELKDHEKAVAAYQHYAKLAEGDDFLEPVALYNLAAAEMDAGKFEDALAHLEKALGAKETAGVLGANMLISKALCQARLGKSAEAADTLNKLETDYSVQADALGAPVLRQALALNLPDAFGTQWLSPEQVGDSKEADAEADSDEAGE